MANSDKKTLNPKQAAFVREYLIDLNATQAAKRAGYALRPCVGLVGYYVYALIDPRDGRIFYIGKGKGKRFAQHEREWRLSRVLNAAKFSRIGDICAAGMKPQAICVMDGLFEGEAFDIERALIAAIGVENLTNYARGQQSEESKLIAWAKDAAMRLKPFEQWRAEETRSPAQITAYFVVAVSIAEICLGRVLPDARLLLGTGRYQANG